MTNYLPMGIVNSQNLMFVLETTTLKPDIAIAIQNVLNGKFIKTYTNRDFLKKCGESSDYKFMNTSQIAVLHINIL